MSLPPWAEGPFELILHGELHYRAGNDFDRRMAFISFDNAIEVSITTYLSLHPIQRQSRTYTNADVERWLTNYHTKLDFFEGECNQRQVVIEIAKSHIVWYHSIRNEQYHGGSPSVPNVRELREIRRACLWVFSVLYDVPDAAQILDARIAELITADEKPARQDDIDHALDDTFGLVILAGGKYYTSELLHSFDPVAYRELGLELINAPKTIEDSE